MDSHKIPNEEKLEIQVYLETALGRKVTIESIQKVNSDRNESYKDQISYKVWLYSPEILREVTNIMSRQNELSQNKFSHNQKFIKFKLGQIQIEDLKTANQGLNQSDCFIAVLARAYVGKSQSYYVDDDPANLKDFKFSQTDNYECYYLHQKQNETNKTNYFNHWYLVRDPKRIVYLHVVKFQMDTTEIVNILFKQKCIKGCVNTNDLRYCHNDNKYFCANCDDEYHNKSHKTLKNHKRSSAMTFSITYQGNCSVPGHQLKAYEFFCVQCKAVYCIKDIHEGSHKNLEGHEIKYLYDVYNSFEQDAKSLTERIRQLKKSIDEEMEDRDKHSKEIQKKYTSAHAAIDERLYKAYDDLHKEIVHRCTYLASLSLELQRINTEIEAKIAFIRNQFHNADYATHIAMTTVFNNYMRNELLYNLEMLMNINYEGISNGIFEIKKKDGSHI